MALNTNNNNMTLGAVANTSQQQQLAAISLTNQQGAQIFTSKEVYVYKGFSASLGAVFRPHSQLKIATFFFLIPCYHVCFSQLRKKRILVIIS